MPRGRLAGWPTETRKMHKTLILGTNLKRKKRLTLIRWQGAERGDLVLAGDVAGEAANLADDALPAEADHEGRAVIALERGGEGADEELVGLGAEGQGARQRGRVGQREGAGAVGRGRVGQAQALLLLLGLHLHLHLHLNVQLLHVLSCHHVHSLHKASIRPSVVEGRAARHSARSRRHLGLLGAHVGGGLAVVAAREDGRRPVVLDVPFLAVSRRCPPDGGLLEELLQEGHLGDGPV